MASPPTTLARRSTFALLPAIVRLSWWRLRRMWQSLLLTWLGMMAMVVLICAVPLFSQVASTIGLRAAINSIPANQQNITVNFYSMHPTSNQILQAQQRINQAVQANMGSYLKSNPLFSVSTPPLSLRPTTPAAQNGSPSMLAITGYDLARVGNELTVIQGRLPSAVSDQIEVALTQAEATSLKAGPGSVLTAQFLDSIEGQPTWTIHVVGIFTVKSNWSYSNTFKMMANSNQTIYPVLSSSSEMVSQISSLQVTTNDKNVFGNKRVFINALNGDASGGLPFFGFAWNYALDTTHLDANHMDAFINGGNTLQSALPDLLQLLPDASPLQTRQIGEVVSVVTGYQLQIAIATVPIIALLVLIIGLLIFLVSSMSVALVERQTSTIATLRSRGATRRHVFGAFVTQGTLLGLLTLILGPFVAILLVELLVHLLMASTPASSLNVLLNNPWLTALNVGWYALATVACTVLTLVIAIRRATQMDVLTFRRESARSTRTPFWRRLHLDIVGVVLLGLGYLGYLYLSQPARAGLLGNGLPALLGVMALCAPFLAALVCVSLFLRLFPLCLRLCSFLAARRRKAPAVLAFAQMERAPRPASRMILLLLLVIASTMFTLTYTATQHQRTSDAIDFAIGADFSGPSITNSQNMSIDQETATIYANRMGVLSASLGYEDGKIQSPSGVQTSVIAVDPATYGSTIIWHSAYADQPLSSLIALLKSHRADATQGNTVYAIIDEAMAKAENLQVGSPFILPTSDGYSIHYKVAAIIHYIPGVYGNSIGSIVDGLLCDYQSYATVYQQNSGVSLDPNMVWLKTGEDDASLKSVRAAFPELQDRRANLLNAETNPLYVNVDGMFYLGIATALLLALLGTLFFSWVNTSGRLTNFAVLRALGMRPRQIATVLFWEQGGIYVFALVLGLALGSFLLTFVGPALVFTDFVTAIREQSQVYNLPVNLLVPGWLILALLGSLIVICAIALLMMARMVARPSLSQTLRLNED
jgi:ABC-type antimicrobial peptide transport system permease subunit